MQDFINEALMKRKIRDMILQPSQGQSVADMEPVQNRRIEEVMNTPPPEIKTQMQASPDLGVPLDDAGTPPPTDREQSASAYRKILMEGMPSQADYAPSKKRRVFAAIAGGFAGLRDPKLGMQLADNIVKDPYNQAVSEWGRRANNAGTLAKFDESSFLDDAKARHLGAQTEAEVARKNAELARANYNNRRVVEWKPSTEDEANRHLQFQTNEKIREGQVLHPGQTYKITLNDGTTVPGTYDRETGMFLNGQTKIDPRKDVKKWALDAKDPKTDEPNTPYEMAVASFKQAHNGRAPSTPQELKEVMSNAESASVQNARQVQINLGGLKLGDERTSRSDAVIESILQNIKNNPEAYHGLPENTKKIITNEMATRGMPIPAKVTGAIEDRANRADVTLQHIAQLRPMINDPKMQQFIGPLDGRMAKFIMGVVGAPPPGVSDADAQRANELRSRLNQFLIQEVTVANSRPAKQLLDLLKSSAPDMKQALPLLKGAIDAAEASAKMTKQSKTNVQFGTAAPQQGSTGNKYLDLLKALE